jgi:hypothetical protein
VFFQKSDDDTSYFDYQFTSQNTDFIFKDPILGKSSLKEEKEEITKEVPGFEFSLHKKV